MRRALIACLALAAGPAAGGEADVVDVDLVREGDAWRVEVTVRHRDEGWDHYADVWEIVAPDGAVLGERPLLHPHVEEQPFTRSLRGVEIPPDVEEVTIRAHDSVHEWGGDARTVRVPR